MKKIKNDLFDKRDEKKWRRSLLWCPTQIYRLVYVGHLSLELYLRWRWSDPFTFNIFKPESEITSSHFNYNEQFESELKIGSFDCLFEKNNLFFSDKEYKKAEKAANQIWYDIEKPRILGLIKHNPELLI